MKLPYILTFDLDNTIIGDSDNYYNFKNFKNFINKAHKVGAIDLTNDELNKVNNYDFFLENPDFIRKDIIEFIKYMNKNYKNIEIFIYSLAMTSHILEFVNNIEKQLNIKINKPYLNRVEHCYYNGEYYKSFDLIVNDIKKTLFNKYPDLNKISNDKLINENFIFFDDRNDHLYENKYLDRLVTFKPYNYIPFINLQDFIPEKYKFNKEINNFLWNETFYGNIPYAFYYKDTNETTLNHRIKYKNINFKNSNSYNYLKISEDGNINFINNDKHDTNNTDDKNNVDDNLTFIEKNINNIIYESNILSSSNKIQKIFTNEIKPYIFKNINKKKNK